MLELKAVVINSQEPRQLILDMLTHLRSFEERGAVKANWIEDVYSEVLKGLEQDNLADKFWIEDLIDICCKQLNAMAQIDARVSGFHFGEVAPGRWGWSRNERY